MATVGCIERRDRLEPLIQCSHRQIEYKGVDYPPVQLVPSPHRNFWNTGITNPSKYKQSRVIQTGQERRWAGRDVGQWAISF